MQRSIKFRAQRKFHGNWVYGEIGRHHTLYDADTNVEYVTLALFWELIKDGSLDVSTLGEFTGLLEKQGKEVYEGDIVRGDEGDTAIVKWDDCSDWHIVSGFFLEFSLSHADSALEVIGNIYENPELLEKEVAHSS